MKKLTIAALVAAQLASVAQPAMAADLVQQETPRMGAFAGARLRIPLGGAREERRLRAGLTLAPTMRNQGADGASRLSFGEGLEFGIAGREPARLSLAGVPVNRLARSGTGPDGQRLGISTIGWIAIGVGTAIVIVVGAAVICSQDSDCLPSE